MLRNSLLSYPYPLQFASLSSHYSQASPSLSFFYHSSFHSNPRHNNAQSSIVLCLASNKKPRASRKIMSDAELCSVLREFVALIGLPEGYVPSTKELLEHGRKDLAHIVRRRGHKLIKELLTNSNETATDGYDSQRSLNGDLNGSSACEETGQEEKVNDVIEKATDVSLMHDNSTTGASLVGRYESAVISDDESPVSIEPPASLQEKVENFMKYGQLDTVEDDLRGDLNLNDVEEGEISRYSEGVVEGEPVNYDEENVRHLARISSNNTGLNGTLMTSKLDESTAMEDNFARDIYLSTQGQQGTDFDMDPNIETCKLEKEVELNYLRHMLHQKELELSQLKEQIEKEKQALSILQAKAEDEISKAQKLISEKDSELIAAEDSLSGLVEAKVQYSGEGQIVEVAGSFNGWHQRIKMDPLPSSAVMNPIGSRKSRLWSTTLWLYPGVYEIKFIVDGNWKIDPQRESTIMGGIENNVLRVDR